MPKTTTIAFIPIGLLLLCSVVSYQRNAVWLDEAILWKNVLANAPNKERAYYPVGLHYLRTGRYHEAVPYLAQASGYQPFHIPIYWDLISAYRNTGKLDKMIETYEKALAAIMVLDEPTPIHRYFAIRLNTELAAVLYEKGDSAGAKKRVEEALSIDPANAQARFLLDRILAEQRFSRTSPK